MKRKTEDTKKVAKRLAELIENSPYSEEEISQLCVIPKKTLSEYKKDGMIPVETAMTLASFFGVSITELIYHELSSYRYNVGERLEDLRKERNLNQEDIGNYLGVGNTAVSKMENNLSSVSIDDLHMLADFYGVSPAYITGEINFRTLDEYIKHKNKIDFQAQRLKPFMKDDKFNEESFVLQGFENEIFKRSAGSKNYCENICDFINSITNAAFDQINDYSTDKTISPIPPATLRYYLDCMVNSIILRYEEDLVEVGALDKDKFRYEETKDFTDFILAAYEENPADFATDEIEEEKDSGTNDFFVDF